MAIIITRDGDAWVKIFNKKISQLGYLKLKLKYILRIEHIETKTEGRRQAGGRAGR